MNEDDYDDYFCAAYTPVPTTQAPTSPDAVSTTSTPASARTTASPKTATPNTATPNTTTPNTSSAPTPNTTAPNTSSTPADITPRTTPNTTTLNTSSTHPTATPKTVATLVPTATPTTTITTHTHTFASSTSTRRGSVVRDAAGDDEEDDALREGWARAVARRETMLQQRRLENSEPDDITTSPSTQVVQVVSAEMSAPSLTRSRTPPPQSTQATPPGRGEPKKVTVTARLYAVAAPPSSSTPEEVDASATAAFTALQHVKVKLVGEVLWVRKGEVRSGNRFGGDISRCDSCALMLQQVTLKGCRAPLIGDSWPPFACL